MVRKNPKEAEGGVLEGLIDSEILSRRQPVAKPSFTIGDIRRAIPPHCFKHSLLISFGYLFLDLVIVFSLMFVANFLDSRILTDEVFGSLWGYILRSAMWCVYWAVNGCVMTGLWVIGHECGHGGFSADESVNNVVGIIIHSLLLVPFFSWKISHRRHHSNTGNVDRDEVFVPTVKDASHQDLDEDDTPLKAAKTSVMRMVNITIMLLLGWPIYLWVNATGHKSYPKVWVNHFHPSSPIFTSDKERNQVLISDVALLVVISFFGYLCYQYSLVWFIKIYFIPYLVVNLFLVSITFLQHTDYTLPHYTSHDWDWLKGALATVDRDFGILNIVFHRITDTHVVHHLFSAMPFYHAKEATEAVKPLLGEYYRFDDTHWIKAMWKNFPCEIVRPDSPKTSILWFHHPKSKKDASKQQTEKQVD